MSMRRAFLLFIGVLVAACSGVAAAYWLVLDLCDSELSQWVNQHSGCALSLEWGRAHSARDHQILIVGAVDTASLDAPWGGRLELEQVELKWRLADLAAMGTYQELAISSARIPSGRTDELRSSDGPAGHAGGVSWPAFQVVGLSLKPNQRGVGVPQGRPDSHRWSGRLRVEGPVAWSSLDTAGTADAADAPVRVSLVGVIGFEGEVQGIPVSNTLVSLPNGPGQSGGAASVALDFTEAAVSFADREVKAAGVPFELIGFWAPGDPVRLFAQSHLVQVAGRFDLAGRSMSEDERVSSGSGQAQRARILVRLAAGAQVKATRAVVDALLKEDLLVDEGSLLVDCADVSRECLGNWVALPLGWLSFFASQGESDALLRALRDVRLSGTGQWKVSQGRHELDVRVDSGTGVVRAAELRKEIEAAISRFVPADVLQFASQALLQLPGPAGSETLNNLLGERTASSNLLDLLLPDDLPVDHLAGVVRLEWSPVEVGHDARHAFFLSLKSGVRDFQSWHAIKGLAHLGWIGPSFPPPWPASPAQGGVRLGIQGAGHVDLRLNVRPDLQHAEVSLDDAEVQRLMNLAVSSGLAGVKGVPVKVTIPSGAELKQIEKDGKKWLDGFLKLQNEAASSEEKEEARQRMKESGDTLKGALRKLLGDP
jgi:hypothetical protein